MQIPNDQNALMLYASLAGAAAVFLFNAVWGRGEKSWDKLVDSNRDLALVMVELKVEIKNMKEVYSMHRADIEKLKSDVNVLHSRLRETPGKTRQ